MSSPNNLNKPRLRFAPSPTGYVHFGGLRTYLFDYLFVKKNGGTLLLRIEDTDATRLVPDAVPALLRVLRALGLPYDEGVFFDDHDALVQRGDFGPYIQSERLPIYHQHVAALLKSGHAYYCFCTSERLQQLRTEQERAKLPPRYDGLCRKLDPAVAEQRRAKGERTVVRLAVPEQGTTVFHDLLRGDISVENALIDDQVLLKSDGFPTYHLASVVDDHLMQITHVTRAEEWLPSTPKHVLLYQAFGWTPPLFVHFSMLLNEQRKKLSKREMDVSVASMLEQGFLPEALINFGALLGWHPQDEKEVFTLPELVTVFDFDRLQKAGAIFALPKLVWLNQQHLRALSDDALLQRLLPYLSLQRVGESYQSSAGVDYAVPSLLALVQAIRDRLERLSDAPTLADFFFTDALHYDSQLLITKQGNAAQALQALQWAKEQLENLMDEKFTAEILREHFLAAITEKGLSRGEVLWPLRVALTGKAQSPDVFLVAAALGKTKTISRVSFACNLLA